MTEQDVLQALRALADSDREMAGAPELGNRLRFVFRQRQRQRKWRIRAAWAMAAAAIIGIFVAGVRPGRHLQSAQVTNATPIETRVIAPVSAPPESITVAPEPKVVRARRAPGREIMTEFFPLVDAFAEGAEPIERGEMVRVSLPAAAMRTVGLPVREDRLSERVQADVLVSEEGLATAIRFVKYSGESK